MTMRSMKRWLCVASLALMAAGCGGPAGESAQPPPAAATVEEGKAATSEVQAGMPKDMRPPGVAVPK
jgi:hypothetical protein